MPDNPDTSHGWCCDGRTWTEHAHEDGHCCQPENTQMADLPAGAQKQARERLENSS